MRKRNSRGGGPIDGTCAGTGQAGGTPFQLRPFATVPFAEQLALSGLLARTSGSLCIEYQVRGALEHICRPAIDQVSNRCHELWRHTCFELFFGRRGEAGYWEVNLCLSGRWNIYRFDGYRSGMREESLASAPRWGLEAGSDFMALTCAVDVSTMVDDSSDLEIGVSGIIEFVDGSIGHWAIAHRGEAPDFHDRQCFVIRLPKISGVERASSLA